MNQENKIVGCCLTQCCPSRCSCWHGDPAWPDSQQTTPESPRKPTWRSGDCCYGDSCVCQILNGWHWTSVSQHSLQLTRGFQCEGGWKSPRGDNRLGTGAWNLHVQINKVLLKLYIYSHWDANKMSLLVASSVNYK